MNNLQYLTEKDLEYFRNKQKEGEPVRIIYLDSEVLDKISFDDIDRMEKEARDKNGEQPTAEEMEHPIRELSGGQKAKVLLLKLSMSGANVLILDEPTRNFSPLSGPVIRRMLKEFPGAIISVSHDRKYLSETCDKIYRLTPEGLIAQE